MKTTGDVLESNYCNVLSQKHRQVFKPLAGVTLLALIIWFDVISHHEERNPSYMINCAVVKTASTLQKFFSCCHQIKYPSHLQRGSLWGSVWSSSRVRLREKILTLRGKVWGRSPGIPRSPPVRWPSQARLPVACREPGTATQSCFCTTGAAFHLREINSCLT